MATDTTIDSSHLTGKYLKRFRRIEAYVLSSYERALGELKGSISLPYPPVVRVTPFVVVKTRRHKGSMFKQTYFAFTTIDCMNFDRFAIYPSLDFLEKFPNYVAAGLGHEIGHVIAFGGKMNVTKEQLVEQLTSPLAAERRRENEMETALQSFNVKFRAEIIEWNGVIQNKDFKEFLVEHAWIQSPEQFESLFFGESKDKLDKYRIAAARRALET